MQVIENEGDKSSTMSKTNPRPLLQHAQTGNDDITFYRRSLDQRRFSAQLQVRNRFIMVDKIWVVPHNFLLLKTFDTHIRVEQYTSIKSIKYGMCASTITKNQIWQHAAFDLIVIALSTCPKLS